MTSWAPIRCGLLSVVLAVLALASVPAVAGAQPAGQTPARRPSRGIEFGVGALVGPGVPYGEASADLVRSDGNPLTLFDTENRQGFEYGATVHVAGPVRSRWFVEVNASVSRATFETTVRDDFEDVGDLTIAEPFYRFTAESGIGWNMHHSERVSVFLRGTAGWMRELAGEGTFGRNGAVANVGVGVKYWSPRRPPRRLRYGLRVEGHLAARWNGIALDTHTIHLAPVVTAGFIIGS
jgi:hypothetical protein